MAMSALYIGLGLLWAVAVWFIYYEYGGDTAIDPQIATLPTPEAEAWEAVTLCMTGHLVEKALAMDNVFVISMIFTYFAVILVATGVKMLYAIDDQPDIANNVALSFAITPDPFIVYTSNIFAILGLRALYFALPAMVHNFHCLKYALIFIGAKIFLGDWLFGGVVYSLWKSRGLPPVASA
jgi:uncharacterized membrane protein